MADCQIEICFGDQDLQLVRECCVPAGTTARAAILASDLPDKFPKYDFSLLLCGVYGRQVPDDYKVRPGDRVEVYRPLEIDPKERRRLRAKTHS